MEVFDFGGELSADIDSVAIARRPTFINVASEQLAAIHSYTYAISTKIQYGPYYMANSNSKISSIPIFLTRKAMHSVHNVILEVEFGTFGLRYESYRMIA